MRHQQPKHVKPGFLRERAERSAPRLIFKEHQERGARPRDQAEQERRLTNKRREQGHAEADNQTDCHGTQQPFTVQLMPIMSVKALKSAQARRLPTKPGRSRRLMLSRISRWPAPAALRNPREAATSARGRR